jgi:UDP-N-acetylglucosamine acyltransferase
MKYIHETAIIYPNVIIEDNVYIGPYCIIGAPPEWKGREKDSTGVYIAEGTRITGLVTIDSGANGVTFIGRDCYIMKGAHVGHDAILKNGVTLSCGAKVGGHAVIGEYTNIGLNATIHQKLNIPSGCMIGMGAVVTKKTELKENCKYAGVPAKFIGSNDRSNIS